MNSIHDLVGEKIVALLTAAFVGVPDDYKPTSIRQGLSQEDPVKRRIAILVNPGDADDQSSKPSWASSAARGENLFELPTREVDGGGFWWLRYSVDIDVYLIQTKEDRETARKIGMFVFDRAWKSLDYKYFSVSSDDGQSAFMSIVERHAPYESGGPPTSFIWRGKLFVQVAVETP